MLVRSFFENTCGRCLETKHHEVCLRSCVFHPPGGSRTPPGPGYGALRPLIFDDFLKKCLSEASSKTRPEGDEREEKKLREAELLKNASEPRRSGAKPPWIRRGFLEASGVCFDCSGAVPVGTAEECKAFLRRLPSKG